jgi:hypothetical protein
MSNGSELKSPSAAALRAAGYVPLPRWWVTQEDLELIAYMARKHADEVNRIRSEAKNNVQKEIDKAWKQHLMRDA